MRYDVFAIQLGEYHRKSSSEYVSNDGGQDLNQRGEQLCMVVRYALAKTLAIFSVCELVENPKYSDGPDHFEKDEHRAIHNAIEDTVQQVWNEHNRHVSELE